MIENQSEEDEVVRRLRRTDYSEVQRRIQQAVDDYRAGKIDLLQFTKSSVAVVEECGWTSSEARAYERAHRIYWNVYR